MITLHVIHDLSIFSLKSSDFVASESMLGGKEDSSCISSALSFGEVAGLVVELPVDTASFNVEHNTIDVRIFTVAIKNYMKLHTC